MINSSKLNSAKLKISELKEKYSKNLNSSTSEETSVSYPSNHPNVKKREPNKIRVENKKDKIANCHQTSLENTLLSNNGSKLLSSKNVDPESKQLCINTIHGSLQSKQSSNKLLLSSPKSESELVSDLSQELKNVHFMYNLSDEPSVCSQSPMLSKHEQSLILNSNPTPVTPDIKNYNSLNSHVNFFESNLIEYNNQTAIPHEKDTYVDEMIHEEIDTTMSSIEEAITPFESDSEEEYLESKSSETAASHSLHLNVDNEDHNKIEIGDSQHGSVHSQMLNGHSKSVPINQHKNATELSLNDTPINQESSVKVTVAEHCDSENLSSKNTSLCSDLNDNNLSDLITATGCEVPFHTNGGKTINREDFVEKINRNKSSKMLRIRSNTFTGSLPAHHKITLKPALKQRPILKSCKLFKSAEENKDEFETLVRKATGNYVYSTLDGKGPFLCKDKTGTCCDGIIKQLLQNQIQLTRHFISSHHEMYLHCCRTTKVLNNKLVFDQYGEGMV